MNSYLVLKGGCSLVEEISPSSSNQRVTPPEGAGPQILQVTQSGNYDRSSVLESPLWTQEGSPKEAEWKLKE